LGIHSDGALKLGLSLQTGLETYSCESLSWTWCLKTQMLYWYSFCNLTCSLSVVIFGKWKTKKGGQHAAGSVRDIFFEKFTNLQRNWQNFRNHISILNMRALAFLTKSQFQTFNYEPHFGGYDFNHMPDTMDNELLHTLIQTTVQI